MLAKSATLHGKVNTVSSILGKNGGVCFGPLHCIVESQ